MFVHNHIPVIPGNSSDNQKRICEYTTRNIPIDFVVHNFIPAMFWQGFDVPTATNFGLLAVLALGPGNGHLLVNWAHRRISAALSSLVLASIPLLSSLWAYLVLGEQFTLRHGIGMVIVILAIEIGRRAEANA